MKRNLYLIILLLFTATWLAGQKAPEQLRPGKETEKQRTANQSDFQTKQSVKSSSLGAYFHESFEGDVFPPTGWKVIEGGSPNRTWERYTDIPITGDASAAIKASSSHEHDDWLITPPLNPVAGCSSLTFKAKQGSSGSWDKFNVLLSTTGNNKEDFTITLASKVGPTSMKVETFAYDLSEYIGQTVYVAIQAITRSAFMLIIDDFAITPTNLGVTGGHKDYKQIPLSQLDNAFTLKTNIVNQGQQLTENVNVTATLKNAGNTTLFTSTDVLNAGLGAGKTKTISSAATFDATTLPTGNYTYTHTADYAADYDPADNSDVFNFSVTDFIYARDTGVFAEEGFGHESIMTFGNLFQIVNATTISGIQFVWPNTLDATTAPYQLALYKLGSSAYMNVTETVFTTETYIRDQSQAGQTMNIAVSPKELQPGLYVLAVKQTTEKRIQMAYDKNGDGFFCIANYPHSPSAFDVFRGWGSLSLRMDLTPRNTVSFTVTEQGSSSPLEGTTITFKQGETVVHSAVTNSEGLAEIYVPAGDYTYSVKKVGYMAKNDIAISINGEMSVNVEMESIPPTLEITPTSFTFAERPMETKSEPQTFTMQNIGTGTISMSRSDITITGTDADQFFLYVDEYTMNLGPGQTAIFTVMFTPTTTGEKTATVKVNDNLGNIHEISVTGSAVDLTVTEFPYIVSFDDEMFPPLGWVSSGDNPWERATTGTNPTCEPFGAGMLKYNSHSYGQYSIGTLTSRRLNISDGNYAVKFKMYRDFAYSQRKDRVDVYAHYQSNSTGALKIGTIYRPRTLEPAVDADGWYDYSFNIPATVTYNYVTKPTAYIFLVATGMYGNNIFVDEFVIGETNTVTLIANPTGGGTLTGGGSYLAGTEVNLTATPNTGYKFINWTNADNEVVCTTETYNYVVGSSDVTFTANFEKLPVVTFTVVDTENNPIKEATVTVKQGETVIDTSVSNSSGKAVIYAVTGDYSYSVNAPGYLPKNDVSFTISGDMAIEVQLEVIPPVLEITPTEFTFAATQIATSSALQVFTMQNTGGGTITINPSDITITGTDADQFTLINIESTVNLSADEVEYFGVAFTPTTIGNKTATIEVNDNIETTHCINITGIGADFTISAFPYKETFDGNEFPPAGWSTLGDDDEPWERVASGVNPTCSPFGEAMLKYDCWSNSSGSRGTLISRRLDMGSETYNVGFKMYRDDNYADCADKVDVYINTKPNKTGATKLGTIHRNMELSPAVSAMGWYDYAFEVPAGFVGNFSYIILQATSDYGTNIYVDEFVVGKKRTVTLAANSDTGGTVTGGGSYIEGTETQLTATPKTGYVLKNWTNADNEIVSKAETFNYVVGNSDVTFTANFELGHTVTFTVVDSENKPIESADIAINETSLTTNVSGVATIRLADGNYPYTISKVDFATVSETAVVSGADLPINITLQAQVYKPFEVAAEVVNGNQVKVVWNPSFEDDMESYDDFIIENIGNYTLADVDNTPTYSSGTFDFQNEGYTGSYIVFNPSATTPAATSNQLLPHSGNKYLACFAAIPNLGSSNNDWLITHQITVVPGMRFSFWAKTYDEDNGLERFKVAVSTTNTDVGSFTFLTGSRFVEAPLEWTQHTYSLDAYAGQQVYLAINCVSDDAFIFMLDDIYIGGAKVGESATLTGYNIYLDGVQVATNVTTTEYTIPDISGGTHTVGVQSVYASEVSEIVTTSITVQQTYTVTFTVVDAKNNPVEGASIVINEDTLTTDVSGTATINLANGDYNYTVSISGYADLTGSFTVNNDAQTIPISLLTTEIDKLTTNSVQLYPNPVKNTLIIERNNSDEVVIELYSINGLLLNTTKTENRTTTLNVEVLSSGTYFIKIIGTDNTPTVHRFIKQ